MATRRGKGWQWVGLIVVLTGHCCGQINREPVCSSDIRMTASGCELSIQTMSEILKDYYDGQEDRVAFCRDKFERCVTAIQTAHDRKCPNIDATEQYYHARVNALRGLCHDIEAWQNYKPCIDAQMQGELVPCERAYYRDKQNFTRTEFKDGQYSSEFARRNARCRVLRNYQECTENVIYANCRNYYGYFRDYQVALLLPYCRQLFQLTSRYVTDDPNTAGSPSAVSMWVTGSAVFLSVWLKKTI